MPDKPEYGLVMPFVCCESNGGPYNDTAFVAGARWGKDYADLTEWAKSPSSAMETYVYPEMVAQYDLLAMHLGLTMKAEPWDEHPDEWVLLTFVSGAGQGDHDGD